MVGGLMYLLDTNVWLELLLEQERAKEVRELLEKTSPRSLAITEFSLYSIGVILTKLKKDSLFLDFVLDTVVASGVIQVRLAAADMSELVSIWREFDLDFDDAYQYLSALKQHCMLVSFDSDFDRTERGRKTPETILRA